MNGLKGGGCAGGGAGTWSIRVSKWSAVLMVDLLGITCGGDGGDKVIVGIYRVVRMSD